MILFFDTSALVMDSGAIGIIDYGMTGSLDQSLKRAILRLFCL